MPIATLRMEILEAAVRHNNNDNVTRHMTCAYVTPMTDMSMNSMMIIIDIGLIVFIH